ncbi:MAG: 4Fe-4S binding protein [Desulfovibrionaceae bacterium]|nr:4Fe-4S binding protein [Desulfovibrionaceae bacterium]
MHINRKIVRRICQATVALSFIAIPWLNMHDIRFVTGNLLSFEFLKIPFADPLAALQVWVSTGHMAITPALGAMLVLTLAVAMGPVFCGWICPYGLMADLVGKLPPRRTTTPSSKAWYIKGTVALIVVGALALTGAPPLLNQLSLPGWYTRTMQMLWLYGVIPAGFWLLPFAACLDLGGGRRFWCRYICPQSLLLQLAGRILPYRFRVVYDPGRCICKDQSPSPCSQACPYGLDPRERAIHPECTNCGDCVVRCAHFGHALSQGFAKRQ